jgi:hypothetical protein
VNIRSTDPVHPAVSFTVSGTLLPFSDLGVSLGAVNFPGSGTVTGGGATKFKFPIVATNTGSVVVPTNSQAVDVQVYLHNTQTDALTLISPDGLTSTIFRNLAVGKSKTLTLSMPIPAGVSPGMYDVRVMVDQSNLLSETTLSNNTATSSQRIAVV